MPESYQFARQIIDDDVYKQVTPRVEQLSGCVRRRGSRANDVRHDVTRLPVETPVTLHVINKQVLVGRERCIIVEMLSCCFDPSA